MGLTITIEGGANYSAVGGIDVDATAWLTANGIVDATIVNRTNQFVKKLKANNLWSRIGYLYPILGTTANQIKFNLKDVNSAVLKDSSGGAITNTINKGIVLTGSGSTPGATVVSPCSSTYLREIIDTDGGHLMYLINETLAPSQTGGGTPNLCIVLSETVGTTPGTGILFSGSGKFAVKKTFTLGGAAFEQTPVYLTKGTFACVVNGVNGTFFGNKAKITTVAKSGTTGASTGYLSFGGTSYPVNNTLSLISAGKGNFTDAEMILYQTLCQELITNVHGITF